jgi:hypothetical protein
MRFASAIDRLNCAFILLAKPFHFPTPMLAVSGTTLDLVIEAAGTMIAMAKFLTTKNEAWQALSPATYKP